MDENLSPIGYEKQQKFYGNDKMCCINSHGSDVQSSMAYAFGFQSLHGFSGKFKYVLLEQTQRFYS